jgi:hypothetical protein
MVKVRWDVDHPKYKGDIVEAAMSEETAKVFAARGRLTIVGPVEEPAAAAKEGDDAEKVDGRKKKRRADADV